MPESRLPIRPGPGPAWRVPFVWTEYAMQRIVYFVSGSATLKVVFGVLALVVATTPLIYVIEAPERDRARDHLKWLVLVDASGRPGGGGAVREILEDFNRRGSKSLAGLRLREKDLAGLQLSLIHL